MPDYQNSKIYKIVCNETNDVYIGSTTQPLSTRMSKHRCDFKRYQAGTYHYVSSFEILKYPTAKILLVRNCPCNSREELEAIEGSFIKNNECVNKITPGRTKAEWYQDNAETIKQRHNQYRKDNAEQIKQRGKRYYQDNTETIKEYKKQKHRCECGGKYTTTGRSQHFHSKKHIAFKKRQVKEFCEVFGLPVSDFNYSIAF